MAFAGLAPLASQPQEPPPPPPPAGASPAPPAAAADDGALEGRWESADSQAEWLRERGGEEGGGPAGDGGGGDWAGVSPEVREQVRWLEGLVDRVLLGAAAQEELSSVRFDRSLATKGASGGAAAEKTELDPALLPLPQLVLLVCKVLQERAAAAAAE